MTAQKFSPDRGYIPIVVNLTAEELTAARATTSAGGYWYSDPIDVSFEMGGAVLGGAAAVRFVGSKRHFPMDGDTTSCTISVRLQGRQAEGAPWMNASAAAAIAAFTDSSLENGDSNDQRSSFSVNSVASKAFSQYRLCIEGFSDAGDAEGASGTPGYNYLIDESSTVQSYTNSDGDIDHTPTAVTSVAQERIRIILPPQAPIPALNQSKYGRKYPTLVICRGTTGPYNNSFPPTAPITTSANMEMEALKRGWGVVYMHVPGNNITISSVDAYWKETPSFDGTTASARDARTAIQWAIQWIRAIGVHAYDLDPDRVFLWGEEEGASHALFAAYDLNSAQDVSSDDLLLRQNPFPNVVGARSPDVEFSVMADTLGGPLVDSGDATQAAATLADATGRANFSVSRIINNKALTSDQLTRFSQLPCYVTADVAEATALNGDTLDYTDGVASWFVPTYPAPGDETVTTQFSEVQTYLWALALRAFSTHQRSQCPLVKDSVINSEETLSTVAANASLITTNETTRASVNKAALQWAENLLGFSAKEVSPQACFDFGIIL